MKKIAIFFLLIFIITYLSAQEWINVSPFTEEQRSIYGNFISEEEGWIYQWGVYIAQTIYHTDDGAQTWNPIYTLEDSLEYFISLQMVDSLHGWATKIWQNNHHPYNNIVYYLRTSDGGYSWEDMTEYMPDVNNAYPFYFINQDIGFFCGGCDSLSLAALIYKTIDGGYNWYLTETPTIYDPYHYLVNYSVVKFFFLDENNGWAACSAFVDAGLSLFSSNGGENWEVGIEPGPPNVFDIHFVNPNYGGAVGRNAFYSFVYITEDNFQTILYFYEAWDLEMGQFAQAICFQNDSTIWVTGEPGIIYRSTDGGASFELFQQFDQELHTIQFFDNTGYTGYIFGRQNALLKFVDTNNITIEEEIQDISVTMYPNPLSNTLNVEYSITKSDKVEILLYNIKGQRVYQQFLGMQNSGTHTWSWTPKNLSSGIYFLQIKGNTFVVNKKVAILK